MKNHLFLLTAIAFSLGIAITSCNKNEIEQKDPKITDENVAVTANSATFTWTVEWVGKRISVVELSQHEDMSNSQFYGSEEELNKSEFIVTVNDLQPGTQYYYRYWVWNQNYVDNKFVMGTKYFSTLNESPVPQVTEGAIEGLFSVSESKKVQFSKGNLQYIGSASTPYWKFADNQWDCLGTSTNQNSTASNVDRDLFGWGTSGYFNSGDPYNTNYFPYSCGNSIVNSTYNYYGYGPSTNQSNLNIAGTHYDWGVHNKISNGGNQEGVWRTLTKEEWNYLLTERHGSSINGADNARFAKAKVNNRKGIILFPDSYSHPTSVAAPFGINYSGNNGWDYNVYTASDWALMEVEGCVFLPAAGYRDWTNVKEWCTSGLYWSASYSDSGYAYCIGFNGSNMGTSSYQYRYFGNSVRLVRNAE